MARALDTDVTIAKCASCGQEMHGADYVRRLRWEVDYWRDIYDRRESQLKKAEAKIVELRKWPI